MNCKKILILLIVHFVGTSVFSMESKTDSGWGDVVEAVLAQSTDCGIWILAQRSVPPGVLKWASDRRTPLRLVTFHQRKGHAVQNHARKYGQEECSHVVAFCESLSACTNAPGFYATLKMVAAQLSPRRKLLLFLNFEMATSVKVSAKDPFIAEVGAAFKSLRAHITLIRPLTPDGITIGNGSSHLVTWTPNWFPGGSPVVFDIWNQETGFRFRNQLSIDVHKIKAGSVLRVCVPSLHMRPLFKQRRMSTFGVAGTHASLIKTLARKLDLKLTFLEPQEKEYGQLLDSGDWTGAVGCIVRRDGDIAVGHLIYDLQRRNADLEFGPWESVLSGVVVCSAPAPLDEGNLLFLPFHEDVWIYVILAAVVTFAFFKILEKITFKFLKPVLIWINYYDSPRVKVERVRFLHILAPICSDSVPDVNIPRRMHFLILIGSWFLFSYLVTVFFSVGLVGLLLHIPLEPEIFSLDDLVDRDEDPWFLTKLVQETIAESEFEVELKLMTSINYISSLGCDAKDVNSDLDLEGFTYIRKTIDNCLVAEETRAKYYLPKFFTRDKAPELYVAKEPFFLGPSGLLFRKDMDFTLQGYISDFMGSYQASGLYQWHFKTFAKGLPEYIYYKTLIRKPEIHALDLAHLNIVFVAFIIGIGISTLVFAAECLYFFWKVKKGKNFNHLKKLFKRPNKPIFGRGNMRVHSKVF